MWLIKSTLNDRTLYAISSQEGKHSEHFSVLMVTVKNERNSIEIQVLSNDKHKMVLLICCMKQAASVVTQSLKRDSGLSIGGGI